MITFAQFDKEYLVGNDHVIAEKEPILDSIDESSKDDKSNYGYVSTKYVDEIWYGNYLHTEINAGYDRLEICNRIGK